MDIRRLKLFAGHYFAIALVLLGLILPLATALTQADPAMAAPKQDTATWVQTKTTSQCSGATIWAELQYTYFNPVTRKLQTDTYTCAVIRQSHATGKYQMTLDGPKDQCNGTPPVIRVANSGSNGLGPDQDYNNATKADWSGNKGTQIHCSQTLYTISLTNTFSSIPQPVNYIGKATWRKMDATHQTGILDFKMDSTSTLGSLGAGSTETFTESGVSTDGNIMTLTGTKSGCGNNRDYIDVGDGTNGYWQATLGTLTTYVAGVDAPGVRCTTLEGTVSLVDKNGKPVLYTDVGGIAPTASDTANGNGCILSGTQLDWLTCQIYGLLQGTTEKLNAAIQSVLFIDTTQVFSPTFQTAFNSFRNIALSVIIISGLIMVASQAAGLEIFSAYTIRKALPKLVFAAIGLALAWPVLEFVVTLFNDLGLWTQSLILAVIAPIHQGTTSTNFGGGLLTALFVGAGVNAGIIGLGAAGLLSLAVTITVALFIAFVTLIIRQIIIVLCVLLAPLAIAASILPGTEGMWKFWRTTLVGSLAMFPIVMGFLASGELVARVANAQATQAGAGSKSDNWVFIVIALVANFLPYAFIPTALSIGNRMIGNVQGMVGKPFAGFQKEQAERRARIRQKNRQDFRAGARFSEGAGATLLSLGTNRLANFVGRQTGTGRIMPSRRMAAIANNTAMTAEQYAKIDPVNFGANIQDETFLAAAAGFSRGELRAMGMLNSREQEASYARAQLLPHNRQVQAAALDGLARTGRFRGTPAQVQGRINAVGVNPAARAAMTTAFTSTSNAVGRPDLAAGSVEQGILGMKPSDVSNLKGAAYQPIFGDGAAGAADAPIVRMLNFGTRTGTRGGQPLTAAERVQLEAVLYGASIEASGRNKIAADAAVAAVAGGISAAGRDAYARHKGAVA